MTRHILGRAGVFSCGMMSLTLAVCGAQPVSAAEPPTPPAANAPAPMPANVSPMRDVKLSAGGRLDGTAYDCQGLPRGATQVLIVRNDQPLASATTDAAGRFAITGLRGGEYTLVVADEMTPCRLWADGSAPPSARPAVQLYGGDLVRGQKFRARNILTSPIVVGAAVGTAVAIPLALHNKEPQS